MTSPKCLSRVASLVAGGTLLLFSRNATSQSVPQSRIAGKQLMIARHAKTPPVIDGVFSPGEWAGAIPVFVEGRSSPATPPGGGANFGLPFFFPSFPPPG